MTFSVEAFEYFHDPAKYDGEASRTQQFSNPAIDLSLKIFRLKKLYIDLIKSIQRASNEDVGKLNIELTELLEKLTEGEFRAIANNKELNKLLTIIILLCRSVLDFNLNINVTKLLNAIETTEKRIRQFTLILVILTVILVLIEVLHSLDAYVFG